MDNRTLAAVSIATIIVLLAASYLIIGPGGDEQDRNDQPASERRHLRANTEGEYFSLVYGDQKLRFDDRIPLSAGGEMEIRIIPDIPAYGTWTGIDDSTAQYEITDAYYNTSTYRVSFDIKGDTSHTVFAFMQMGSLILKYDGTQDIVVNMAQEKL